MLSIKKNFLSHLFHSFPIIILFVVVFTGFDFSFFLYEINFSFKFVSIIVFYWVLNKPHMLGYGLIFFAGLINDVVQNFPIGVSSINYLLLCAIAAFIRARIILPNFLYDWIIFFVAILIVSSIEYSVLNIIFNFPIKYETLMFNSFITFLVYPIFSKIFDEINLLNLRQEDVQEN
tara:strand:+ start:155 stop:682 length:528 start_codon:yes stop_codon:yes gene_type:complete